MKPFVLHVLISLGGIALLAGCAGQQLNPNITVYDRDKVEDMGFSLPGNFSTRNYAKLGLMVLPGTITTNLFDEQTKRVMTDRLQDELAKVKRFSLIPTEGVDLTALYQFQQVGDIALPEDMAPVNVDVVANWNVSIRPERARDGRDQTLTFRCTVGMKLTDLHTRKIAYADNVDFTVVREQNLNRFGRVVEGFRFDDLKDIQGLAQDVAIQTSIRMANALGNAYPAGGQVISMLGLDSMKINRGTEQGIANNMQMAVYTLLGDGEGVPVVIGHAEATPSTDFALLEMWEVNADNKYAARIIEEIEADPFNWLKTHKLYAVGYGMAVPPEWQTKDFYLPE